MKKYELITLDAANTLIYPEPPAWHVYSEVSKRYSVSVEPEKIKIAFKREFEERKQFFYDNKLETSEKTEINWWRNLVYAVFEKYDKKFVQSNKFDKFFNELFDAFAEPRQWRLYDDVKPTLTELKKRGIKTGIISNFDSRLLKICDGLGLNEYLDFIVISALFGKYKPHIDIFKEGLRRAGNIKAIYALHIGDHPTEDGKGAIKAGMDYRLLGRFGEYSSTHLKKISSLDELLKIV